MASLSVRHGGRDVLDRALVAVVVGGLDSNAHEALMVMPLIEDASRRIGVEPQELFSGAATLVGQPGATNLMLWLSREDENRTIEGMGYVVSSDDQGFRYRLNW